MQQNPCRRRAIYAARALDAQTVLTTAHEEQAEQNNNKVCPLREIETEVKSARKRLPKKGNISK